MARQASVGCAASRCTSAVSAAPRLSMVLCRAIAGRRRVAERGLQLHFVARCGRARATEAAALPRSARRQRRRRPCGGGGWWWVEAMRTTEGHGSNVGRQRVPVHDGADAAAHELDLYQRVLDSQQHELLCFCR